MNAVERLRRSHRAADGPLRVLAASGQLGYGIRRKDKAFEIKGIVYGLAIVLFLRFEPDGLIGRWRDLKHYWTHWPFRY